MTLTDTSVILDPLIETRIALRGYCADLFVDPVPHNSNLPIFSKWIPIDINLTTEHFKPDPQKWVKDPNSRILNPSSFHPLNLAIDFEKYPEEIAWFLWKTLINLESGYHKLSAQNFIKTPYSDNKVQERDGVVQHSFWIVTSELNGKYYLKKLFEDGIKKQYIASNLSSFENEQILTGISQFWTAFHLLLEKTQIMDIYKLNSRFVKEVDNEILQLKKGSE